MYRHGKKVSIHAKVIGLPLAYTHFLTTTVRSPGEDRDVQAHGYQSSSSAWSAYAAALLRNIDASGKLLVRSLTSTPSGTDSANVGICESGCDESRTVLVDHRVDWWGVITQVRSVNWVLRKS
jgi:hypothetical protein